MRLGVILQYPKSAPRVVPLLPRLVARRHLVGDVVCEPRVVADQRVEHGAELAAVEAFQRRPHLRRCACRGATGASGGTAFLIRRDRCVVAAALHRCTAHIHTYTHTHTRARTYIYMLHGCTAGSILICSHRGTICAMSAIGVSSVHSDCSCTARASKRSGCRRSQLDRGVRWI